MNEDKDLLLKYLCMALPYHPVLHFVDKVQQDDEYLYGFRENGGLLQINDAYYVDEVKPYLRSLSSMTEEEEKDFHAQIYKAKPYSDGKSYNIYEVIGLNIDWLLKNHFDFIGLIPKDFAIEVTEDNNPYKE